MEVSKYILLLHKKLSGEINADERNALNQWSGQEQNRSLSDSVEKAWVLSKKYKAGYEPDVEAGLSRLQARIAAARQEQEGAVRARLLPRWASAAAAVVLLLAAGWWALAALAGEDTAPSAWYTEAGETVEKFLPDGSRVVLNEHSTLSLAESFSDGATRELQLFGEAYFEVQPDPGRPFVIRTGDAVVEVLGTAFNLRAYPREGFTEVEVVEGKVRLSEAHTSAAVDLQAGERGRCAPGAPLSQRKSPGLNAHSWRTGRLTFRNAPLKEVLEAVERHFKVELRLDNPKMLDCGVTSSFEKASLEEVLENLELILKLEIRAVDSNEQAYRLSGGHCVAR